MIDYKLLNDSIIHYSSKGFQRIESPWIVSEYISNITRPEEKINFQLKHNNKCLVASGEQSFLYLYLKGFLPKGCFQTITPCFRYESLDNLHTKYFLKNELIDTKTVTYSRLMEIVMCAKDFFSNYMSTVFHTQTGPDSFDIKVGDIELGSYGIRRSEFLEWIYGTGCAEPRTSTTIKNMGYHKAEIKKGILGEFS